MDSFLSGDRSIRLHHIGPPSPASPLPALILLHGSGGNIGFWLDRIAPFISLAGARLLLD